MLEKLARVLNGLEECVGKCDSDVSRVASEVTKNATKRSMGEDSNEGRNVMGDICGELEKQNNRLRREVGRLNEENEQLRIEESQRGKLLPEYRLEIVRSRGLAEVAEKSLRAERGAVTQLQVSRTYAGVLRARRYGATHTHTLACSPFTLYLHISRFVNTRRSRRAETA